jgi:hypothetical protein
MLVLPPYSTRWKCLGAAAAGKKKDEVERDILESLRTRIHENN